jgi:hypothetical protein
LRDRYDARHEHRSPSLLRGPSQSNVDFSVAKRFPLTESRDFKFQADFFNVLNHAHRDNPIGDSQYERFREDSECQRQSAHHAVFSEVQF